MFTIKEVWDQICSPENQFFNILTGKVAGKDNQMIAQGGISIIYELNGLVPVLRGCCFMFEVGL